MLEHVVEHIQPLLALPMDKFFVNSVPSATQAPFCIVREISSTNNWAFGRDLIYSENRLEISLYATTYRNAERMGARLNALDQYAGMIDTLTGILLQKEMSFIDFEDEKFYRWIGDYKMLIK